VTVAASSVEALIGLFGDLFAGSHGARLVRGGREPVYLPRDADHPYDRVVFAHGFFASALHEAAHWCVAGPARRRLVDYGYWYKPDGRSAAEQREFEAVEVKPQALEWIFSVAAGTPFHFSADNLGAGGVPASPAWLAFQRRVQEQVHRFLAGGLPDRADRFATALAQTFGGERDWRDPAVYALEAT
jgi:elongation factor P hydroxylase